MGLNVFCIIDYKMGIYFINGFLVLEVKRSVY